MARIAYVDESGTSPDSAVCVVAAVIVDPDKEWKRLYSYINNLMKTYVPEHKQENFSWHATDLLNGKKGTVWDRNGHYQDYGLRKNILCELLEARWRVGFSVVWGFLYADVLDSSSKSRADDLHMQAYANAVLGIEAYMREFALSEEVASLVHEDIPERRSLIKYWQEGFRINKIKVPPGMSELVPTERIIDTTHFVEKGPAPLLQYADACAFALNRYLNERRDGKDLFKAIEGPRTQPMPDDRNRIGFRILASHP